MKKQWLIVALLFGSLCYLLYAHFKNTLQPFHALPAGNSKANTSAGIDSSWLSRVQSDIAASEYRIQWREKAGAYQSCNRAQNLRFTYYDNGFKMSPRLDSLGVWDVELRLSGISKGSTPLGIIEKPARQFNADTMAVDYHAFKIQFINNEKGMRQNFIVCEKPEGNEALTIAIAYKGSLTAIEDDDGGVSFAEYNSQSGAYNSKVSYKDLKAWDATGKELKAKVELNTVAHQIALVINDREARYPVMVDPLSTIADWSIHSSHNGAFGNNVSSAGDVNGDGYSDIIVGAHRYDNGEVDEGRVFVFYGSASGFPATVNWTAESNQRNAQFGRCVSGAGDVNGDGYSDVIIMGSGHVFVYYGGATGLSANANWSAACNPSSSPYDRTVSSAGDVNGDGYSDVIVGEFGYNHNQGVSVYYGSAAGLSATANWTIASDQAEAHFGCSVSGAGDVNGDGYSDVIVGSSYYDNGQNSEGRAFVYYGSATGLSANANWTAESNQYGAYFGSNVSGAGDVNGDGYSDVIVGSPKYDNGEDDEGRAFVYYGSATGLSANANWTAESNQIMGYFGNSVSAAGDVNGDGYADIIVGAYRDNINQGNIFVYFGGASGPSVNANWTAEGASFGNSVSGAGDVNHDGYADIIVGCRSYDYGQGQVFGYYGSTTGLSANANWTAIANHAGGLLGCSVSGAGDVNGDGYSDVIVGASDYDNGEANEGRAFVYYGGVAGLSTIANWTAESNQIDACFGYSVSGAGDFNGDGYSDVIIGAYRYDNGQTDEGRAFVYYGSAAGLSANPNWIAEPNQDSANFGNIVSSVGDVNGDGYSDVIVGAYRYDNGQTNEGRAFVYYGSAAGLSVIANWVAESNQEGASFGYSVSGAGDFNGDGYSDVIIGAYGYENGQPDEGRVFVYYGSASGLSATANWITESNFTSSLLGYRVSSAGDVNADGYSDVIVGSYSQSFVYYGSSTGLSATANWIGAGSGCCAGDVNGDGYSDVIKISGNPSVYYGSAAGLSTITNWTSVEIVVNSGYCAGDVNSDGYSDVILGNEGNAFAYYGCPDGSSAPVITTHPASLSVSEGLTASFTVVATGANLIYRWQKNNADIPGANSSTYTTSSVTQANNKATYRCVVSSGASSILSKSATLTVKAHCPGDLDGDGNVTVADLFIVISHFGQTPVDAEWDPRADANKDDMVSFVDLTEVISNFGKECN